MSLAGESFLWMDSDGEMPNSVERDQEMVPNICKVTSIQLMYTSQLRQGRDTNSAQVNYFNIYNIVYIYICIFYVYTLGVQGHSWVIRKEFPLLGWFQKSSNWTSRVI